VNSFACVLWEMKEFKDLSMSKMRSSNRSDKIAGWESLILAGLPMPQRADSVELRS